MSRAPFQVLVYPYRHLESGGISYALFRRSDHDWWQGIAGGGEDGESPEQAAHREALEEAGVWCDIPILRLETVVPVPVVYFRDSKLWGEDLFVIPQYCFGVSIGGREIVLSAEHSEYVWASYQEAQAMLRFDGNRTALWELHARLTGLGPHGLGMHGLS